MPCTAHPLPRRTGVLGHMPAKRKQANNFFIEDNEMKFNNL